MESLKGLNFLSRMTYGRVSAALRVNIADRHQTACMELQGRLNGCPVSAGNTAVQFFENYRQPDGVRRCRLDGSSRHWLDIQTAAEISLGYSTVAKRNGTKLFNLIPLWISVNLTGLITREICSP